MYDSRYCKAVGIHVPLSRVHFILMRILKVRKISARWISHLLTDEQKRVRVLLRHESPNKGMKHS